MLGVRGQIERGDKVSHALEDITRLQEEKSRRLEEGEVRKAVRILGPGRDARLEEQGERDGGREEDDAPDAQRGAESVFCEEGL